MKKLYFVSTEDTAALRENKLQIVLTDKFLSMDFEGNHKRLATTYKHFVKAFEQATADGVIPAAIAKKAEEMINPYPNGKLAETRDKDDNLIFTQEGDQIFFGAGHEPDGTLDAVFDFDDDRAEGFYIWFKMNLESYADSIAAIEAATAAQMKPAEFAVDTDKKITPAVTDDASSKQIFIQGEDSMKQQNKQAKISTDAAQEFDMQQFDEPAQDNSDNATADINTLQPNAPQQDTDTPKIPAGKKSTSFTSTVETSNLDDIKQKLKFISAETMENHGIVQRARTSGYICPFCRDGSGRDGTGISTKLLSNGQSWYCGKCAKAYDNLDLLAAHFGKDIQRDFKEVIELASDMFNLQLIDFTRPAVEKEVIPDKYKSFITNANARLKSFVDRQGGSWRHLTFDTLNRYFCGYADCYGMRGEPSLPHVIIPTSFNHYLARLVGSPDDYPEANGIKINPKPHHGAKELFGLKLALNDDPIIFLVEGEIDAMTIWQASGFNVIAISGSALNDNMRDQLKHIGSKNFIVLFDNDNTGKGKAPLLVNALTFIGHNAASFSLSDTHKDANDFLAAEPAAFADRLKQIYDDAQNLFARDTDDAGKILLSAAQIDIPFNGYDFMEDTVEDLDNARRLEKFCGKYIHWLEDDERWLTFDGSIWSRRSEKNSCIYPFAVTFADQMMNFAKILDAKANDAAKASVITNSDGSIKKIDEKARKDAEIAKARRDKAFAIAYYFKKRKNYSAAIDLLKGCDSILITAADLNKHKNLLCVKNGVVDLQTGKLYPLAEKYLITNQADVSFDQNADTAFVEKFFSEVIPDEPTRQGVLRYLGYGLTGEKNYHICQFWRGRGANGKSTIIDMLIKLFGSYAIKLPTNAMIEAPRPLDPNAASPALAMLDGDIRLAILDEIPRNCRLDATTFKTITGDQFITARPLYCNPRKIELRAKLILNGNHLPNFDVDDGGLQRRINNVEYTQFFPADRADVTLPNKLTTQENRSALLKILVAQAQEFYRNGLIESDAMKDAKAEYFNENDFVASFVDEYCIVGEGGEIKRKDFESRLTQSYPAETSRLKKKDLLRIVTDRLSALGAAYMKAHGNQNAFRNIRWQS